MDDTLLRELRSVPAFIDLRDDVLLRIAEGSRRLSTEAGEILIREGEQPQFLHVLLEGQVGLTAAGRDRHSTVVEVLKPVDQFILAAVLTDEPYLMSARTLTPAQLLLIDAAQLRALLVAEPRLALTMAATVSQQFRALVRQVKDLKLRSSAQRLGCFLLALVHEQGSAERVILPYDKQLLAARLGMTPENLSRAFATLRAHGVRTSGSRVTVEDVARLTAFASPDET